MIEFPDFMKNSLNKIDSSEQNTEGIEGYYFEAKDGSQSAFWTCYEDRISQKHKHEFDEYILCVTGQYIAYIENHEYILKAGDELHIPKDIEQWGKCIAGTRTIHVFGGKRFYK